MTDNNIIIKPTLDYAEDIKECLLSVVFANLTIEAKGTLVKKLRRRAKAYKAACDHKRHANAILENEIKQAEQQKQCMIAIIESSRSRLEQVKVKYLLVKQDRLNMIERTNTNIKQYEEQWLTITKRWEKIPFIKEYLGKQKQIETVKSNINALKIESNELRSEIDLKKAELWEKDKKNIIEIADFMVNKRPVLLKLIHDKINEIKKLENEQQNAVLAPTLPKVVAKKISTENSWNLSRNNAYDTLVLPKLHLLDMDSQTISQVQNVDYTIAKNKRPFEEAFITVNLTKKAKVAEKIDKEDFSIYFTSSRNVDGSDAKKYSDKKLINILEDVKLDAAGTFKIVSQLKLNQLQDVNVIKARVFQDSKKNDPPQDTVNDKITEVIEEIDLTQKVSQDIILPPTPFLDLTRSSQEKRVTFNSVVTVEDIPNLETDGDDVIPENDYNAINNTPNDQLNASTASDDSYKKIKDFVFKKRNVNLSPEFTYTKNKIVPIIAEGKVVTSKFFDETQAGNDIDDNNSAQEKAKIVEIVDDDCPNPDPEKETNEVPTETMNQDNSTAENLSEAQGDKQKDDVPSGAQWAPYMQSMPDSPNISLSTTGFEDTEFPQCVESSFLLSPKAYDEKQTRDEARNVDVLPRAGANFLSALRKTPFSFLGNSSSLNKPEADGQNDNNKFNFTFGGNEKTKRGGFFSMFQ